MGPVSVRLGAQVLFLFALVADVSAQTGGPNNASPAGVRRLHEVPVPTALAAPRAGEIALDGRLDDAAWNAATPVTDFRQFDPDEGKPGTQRTEMRFLFDDGSLYVGARLFDTAK